MTPLASASNNRVTICSRMIDKVNALVIPVRDVEKCALFYRDMLGFNLDQLEQDEAYLTVGKGDGLVLVLKSIQLSAQEISEERIRPGEETIKRNHCVAFVRDVDSTFGELQKKGVNFVRSPNTKKDGWRAAHFEDPEGNLWEISQRPEG